MLLDRINSPADLRTLSIDELRVLAVEVRQFVVEAVSRQGGHLGSNLGAVELTFAVHRVFDSPRDTVLWDTGHQAYVHKLVTGRRDAFGQLRQESGLSGYPSRAESEHDHVENSHASTILSYAHGLATARDAKARPEVPDRRVGAIIGDGRGLTAGPWRPEPWPARAHRTGWWRRGCSPRGRARTPPWTGSRTGRSPGAAGRRRRAGRSPACARRPGGRCPTAPCPAASRRPGGPRTSAPPRRGWTPGDRPAGTPPRRRTAAPPRRERGARRWRASAGRQAS